MLTLQELASRPNPASQVLINRIFWLIIVTDPSEQCSQLRREWASGRYVRITGYVRQNHVAIKRSSYFNEEATRLLELAIDRLGYTTLADFRVYEIRGYMADFGLICNLESFENLTQRDIMNARKELRDWFETNGLDPALWQPLMVTEEKIV